MITSVCKDIYAAGANNTSIPEYVTSYKHIIGFKNYLELVHYAGTIQCDDINFVIHLVLLINDIQQIKYIESIQTRFTTILNQTTNCTKKMSVLCRAVGIIEKEVNEDMNVFESKNTTESDYKLVNVVKFVILSWILDTIEDIR